MLQTREVNLTEDSKVQRPKQESRCQQKHISCNRRSPINFYPRVSTMLRHYGIWTKKSPAHPTGFGQMKPYSSLIQNINSLTSISYDQMYNSQESSKSSIPNQQRSHCHRLSALRTYLSWHSLPKSLFQAFQPDKITEQCN